MTGRRQKGGNFIIVLPFVLFCIVFFCLLKLGSGQNFTMPDSGEGSLSEANTGAVSQEILEEVPYESEGIEETDTENEENDLWILFDNLKFGRKEAQPRISYYAVILIAYIILLGPVSYFILKRADKMEYMWIYIPVLAVIFSGWIIITNKHTKITKPVVDSLTVLSPQQEDVVYVASTSPGKKSYELLFGPEVKEVTPLYMGGEYILHGGSLWKKARPYTILENEGQISLSLNPQSSFTRDYFRLDLEKKEKDSLEISVDVSGELPEGRIANGTEYDFSYAMVYYQEQFSIYQNVESRETLELEKTKWRSIYNPENKKDQNKMKKEDNVKQLLNFAYEKYLMEAPDDRFYVIGVLSEFTGVMDDSNKNLVSKGIYFQWVDLGKNSLLEEKVESKKVIQQDENVDQNENIEQDENMQ